MKTNMTRLRGRARRGERLIDKTPHGHWKTTTLIAALGMSGIRCSTVVDGAVNGDIFESFVEHILIPELRPGDVVIMDNLSSHKRARTRNLIEAAGAEIEFLPPYSPDLNPIEMVFSKLKQLLRSLGLRTREALWSSMQGVLDQVTPRDAQNCFRHCGYSLGLD
jgi:transposase